MRRCVIPTGYDKCAVLVWKISEIYLAFLRNLFYFGKVLLGKPK